MNWKDYFKLSVYTHGSNNKKPYFQGELRVPEQFSIQDLFIGQFDDWKMSEVEKKKLSLNLRKILICHGLFHTKEFQDLTLKFFEILKVDKTNNLTFFTHGGGVYLFLALMKDYPHLFQSKKIVCYTSEVPLPIFKVPLKDASSLQFIYRPEHITYLSDFPSLWKQSDVLHLFEQKQTTKVA